MVEPIVLAKAGLATWKVAKSVGKLLPAYLGNDSEALVELMRDGDAAWVTDFCERLRERDEVLEQRLREVHPLITSLRWEAARDATDGRRRMLACIAAYLLNTDDAVENKARIERIVRDLDPADMTLLGMLYSLQPEPAFSAWVRSPRRSNLTMCVDVEYSPLAGFGGAGKPTLTVSETGRLVLRALEDFHLETLLAGFEKVSSNVSLADSLAADPGLAPPFWVTRRGTYPLRVLEVGGGPSVKGELFAWDEGRAAYVLGSIAGHQFLHLNEWSILKPRASATFLRQDNAGDGRPLVPCDPVAPATQAELEFMSLPQR